MRGWKVWSILVVMLSGCAFDAESAENSEPQGNAESETAQTVARLESEAPEVAKSPASTPAAATVEADAQAQAPLEEEAQAESSPKGSLDPETIEATPDSKPQPDPWRGQNEHPDNHKPQPDPWHVFLMKQTASSQ